MGDAKQALLFVAVPAANTKRGELKINTGEQTCAGSSNQRTWIHQLIMMAGHTESCLSSTAWELAARDASGKRAPFPVSSALPFKMRGSLLSSDLSQLLEVTLCGAESAQAALAMRDGDEGCRWSRNIEYLTSSANPGGGDDRRVAKVKVRARFSTPVCRAPSF